MDITWRSVEHFLLFNMEVPMGLRLGAIVIALTLLSSEATQLATQTTSQGQSPLLPFIGHNNPPPATPTFDFEYKESSKSHTAPRKDPILSRDDELNLYRLIEHAIFTIKTAETESRKPNYNHDTLVKNVQAVLDDLLKAKKTMQSGVRDGEDLIDLHPANEDLINFESNQPAPAQRAEERLLAEKEREKATGYKEKSTYYQQEEMAKEGQLPMVIAKPVPVRVRHQQKLQQIADGSK